MSNDVQRMMSAVLDFWNTGDPARSREFYAADATRSAPNIPQPLNGFAAIDAYVQQTRAAFPDAKLTFDDMVVSENAIVTKWTFQGTQQGTYLGLAPTNRVVNIRGVTWVVVRDGKIISEDVYFDNMAVAVALGALPAPA